MKSKKIVSLFALLAIMPIAVEAGLGGFGGFMVGSAVGTTVGLGLSAAGRDSRGHAYRQGRRAAKRDAEYKRLQQKRAQKRNGRSNK